jgi:protein-S-isoprenylcysteine O-methyltransferase Ste14
LGVVLDAGWWPQLVIALMLFLLLRIKAQFEEGLLRKAYPKYAAYALKTPMFFPRLGK